MKQLVAVYGTLRKGFSNHRLLSDAVFIGYDHTLPEWDMVSLGGFPALYKGGVTSVTIEVYEVTEAEFKDTDRLEGYPSFYNRELIHTAYGQAWIYYIQGDPREGSPKIKSGDWDSVSERM